MDNDTLAWMALVEADCAALFQTALLLSADLQTAEAAVTLTIENLDLSKAPRQDESSRLQKMVAAQTWRILEKTPFSSTVCVEPLLQSGLQPVLQLEQLARACFVLRFLLGCPVSWCAEKMGLEEGCVERLLVTAVIQLHQVFAQARSAKAGKVFQHL